ncbi:MraY family glycosyltransferase [Methyloterricola oryzae]|uniref:MraY family glycosyltransferase n=1 Tax=Methyloterricola oryzae TaxID=1495050 RepID=UPI0005EAFA8D|nr:glycosyltransferase family 4 protein [Methyloterricola oryzae]
MHFWNAGALLAAVFALSFLITGRVRRYAQGRLLDVPNDRSSHQAPTPRGGGLAIVLAFALGLLVSSAAGWLSGQSLAFLTGGLMVAAVGFWDDHGHVPARWRMLAHVLAAVLAVYGMGGMAVLWVNGQTVALGWAGPVLAVVFIAWMLNLFNFMDGIDGIAAGEALSVAASAAGLSLWFQPDTRLWLAYALLAMAASGFLLWNWPPARIFMGDVGSGFLGFMLGVFALAGGAGGGLSLVVWLILTGVFVVDASFTLAIRMISGQRWYEAHRSHAYQKASRVLGGHKPVTLRVLLINGVWLLPLAALAAARPELELGVLLLAYLPLLILAACLGAGRAS